MEITEAQQHAGDYDWFCVDDLGCIGHFATAGYKKLPQTVTQSSEQQALLLETILALPVSSAFTVDSRLHEEIAPVTDRYLASFTAMAARGFYSFDIASHLHPGTCYFRVAYPETPLRLDQTSPAVRDILSRTKWTGEPLSQVTRIPYQETLHL